jgi:glycosyltransferase involved in cell wall biosynthesis
LRSAATVVLPVHNAERSLRSVILQIFELSSGSVPRFQLVVVDDGSTDGTYETACELARQFPQISVLRQPFQSGIRCVLELVRRRLGVVEVIVHDGATPIDVHELATLLTAPTGTVSGRALSQHGADARGSRRFASIAKLNARLAETSRALGAFRWMHIDEPMTPRRTRHITPSNSAGTDPAASNLDFATMA